MVIRTAYGTRGDKRAYGGGAAAQHSQTLYSVLAHVPGLKVVVPSPPTTPRASPSPPFATTARSSSWNTSSSAAPPRVTFPKRPTRSRSARREVVRSGKDVTLVRHRPDDSRLPRSGRDPAADGASSAEVVDVLTLAPLDEATILESVKRTHRLVVVDEDNPVASMARDIAARVADKGFDWLDAPIKTVTAPDTPVPFSAVLEALYTPRAAQVVAPFASSWAE